jgi:crotonobetainyl-CoA:carnitine CoA-transferase CaiB-like acyl-CoA transferase
MNVLGLHDLAQDPRWETSWYRQAHKDEYSGRVGEAMRGWKKADLFEELAARRVVAGPVLTMEELRSNLHLAERQFWTEADGQDFPGAPFRMSATPWRLRACAPEPPAKEVDAK